MLNEGIIKPSNSPWSSSIVVVPKPDGSLWLCSDFWMLKAFESYPLPRFNDLIERLGGAQFISTLNLMKSYIYIYTQLYIYGQLNSLYNILQILHLSRMSCGMLLLYRSAVEFLN